MNKLLKLSEATDRFAINTTVGFLVVVGVIVAICILWNVKKHGSWAAFREHLRQERIKEVNAERRQQDAEQAFGVAQIVLHILQAKSSFIPRGTEQLGLNELMGEVCERVRGTAGVWVWQVTLQRNTAEILGAPPDEKDIAEWLRAMYRYCIKSNFGLGIWNVTAIGEQADTLIVEFVAIGDGRMEEYKSAFYQKIVPLHPVPKNKNYKL